MKLRDIGEFGLIDLIKQDALSNPEGVFIGIGDDAAAFVPTADRLQLISTDMLVEKVHFVLGYTTPFQLGYKSLAVNFSDIAAMGGVPRHVVISIAIPQDLEVEFVVELYRGMKEIAGEFGVNLIGGDTVSSPQGLVINVAVTGEVAPELIQKRSGAKVGDLVAVTGWLGNSAAGLRCLQNNLREDWFVDALIHDHLMPLPRVAAGTMLSRFASSMNDVSDGLASESMEICRAGKVGMRLDAEKLPYSRELKAAAEDWECDPLDFALYGGEDYELLFTISPDAYTRLAEENDVQDITVIGTVTNQPGVVELELPTKKIVKIAAKGYNHFR